MTMIKKHFVSSCLRGLVATFPALIFLFHGCTSFMAEYDPVALDKAVTLKTDTAKLLEKSFEPYKKHEKEILELLSKANQAYEYAAAKPKNIITTKQWKIMLDPDRNMLAGFFKYWRQKGTLSPFFISEASQIITEGFDTIIDLETRKIKGTEKE
jgi:hypothetical protein